MKNLIIVMFLFSIITQESFAENFHINGFASFGNIKSSNKIPYGKGITDTDDFDYLTKVGLNVIFKLKNEVDAEIQLVTDGLDKDYQMEANIALLRWKYNNNLQIRAGLLRTPSFIINEFFHVAALYPWLLPPTEVYRQNPVENYKGINIEYSFELPRNWFLITDIALGGSNVNFKDNIAKYTGKAEDTYALNIKLTNEIFTLRISNIGAHIDALKYFSADSSTSTGYSSSATNFDLGTASVNTVGLKFDNNSFLIMSEFVEFKTENAAYKDIEANYVTLGKYLKDTKYLMHFTQSYSDESKNVLNSTPLIYDGKTSTQSIGLNIKIDQETLLKLHYQWVRAYQGIGQFTTNSITSKMEDTRIFGIGLATVF